MMRRAMLIVAVLIFATGAGASDGKLEINQACAVNTGCFTGDNAGWPVTIKEPGSYLLTSNLVIVDASQTAIRVDEPSVSIDLGGFEIVTEACFEKSTDCTPESGNGYGVHANVGAIATTVRNGSVTGMGNYGVYVRDQAIVENVRVRWTRLVAIWADGGSTIARNIVSENGNGIGTLGATLALGNTVSDNSGLGISFNDALGGYADNVLGGNSNNVLGGTNMGGNVCDGELCP